MVSHVCVGIEHRHKDKIVREGLDGVIESVNVGKGDPRIIFELVIEALLLPSCLAFGHLCQPAKLVTFELKLKLTCLELRDAQGHFADSQCELLSKRAPSKGAKPIRKT
jgi:hypothetical protein